MFANAFFQNYPFKCDDNITVLTLDENSKPCALFLVTLLSRLNEKYSYAKQVRPHRLKLERIMLPTTPDGAPDWVFMAAYMQRLEGELLQQVIAFYKRLS